MGVEVGGRVCRGVVTGVARGVGEWDGSGVVDGHRRRVVERLARRGDDGADARGREDSCAGCAEGLLVGLYHGLGWDAGMGLRRAFRAPSSRCHGGRWGGVQEGCLWHPL